MRKYNIILGDTPVADPTEKQRPTLERVTVSAFGVAVEMQEALFSGLGAVWNLNKRVLSTAEQVAAPILKPLDNLGVTELVRRQTTAITLRVEETAARLEEKGRAGIEQSETLAVQSLAGTIDAVLAHLADSPALDALLRNEVDKLMPVLAASSAVEQLVRDQVTKILPVLVQDAAIQELIRAQAGQYLEYLRTNNEALQTLIREQGDTYIDYLNAHPDSVQNLVQGQSISLAGDVMDEVRERTVTADSVVELIVRNILRRKPREQLPPPPEQVQRRAEVSRLPSDFLPPTRNGGYE